MAEQNQELLAFIGGKQVELENSRLAFANLNVEYDNLLLTLSRVLSGEVTPDRVTVNMEARSWAVAPAPVLQMVPEPTKPIVASETGESPPQVQP